MEHRQRMLVLIVAIAVGGGAWWLTRELGSTSESSPSTAISTPRDPRPLVMPPVPLALPPPPVEESVAPSSELTDPPEDAGPALHQAMRLPPPPDLVDFWTMSSGQRVAAVARMQRQSRLDAQTLSFLTAAMQQRDVDATTRNLLANVHLIQETPNPQLWRVFAAMATDPHEDPVWSEYAIQHLASSIPSASHPHEAVAILVRIAHEPSGGRPGTAWLHIHRLAEMGVMAWPSEAGEHFAARVSRPRDQDSRTLTTVLSIAGERQIHSLTQPIRAVLATEQPMAVTRAAIVALGVLGDASDVALLTGFEAAGDAPVAEAARAAKRTCVDRNISDGDSGKP